MQGKAAKSVQPAPPPSAVGVNVTLIVQLAPPLPSSRRCWSSAKSPATVMLLTSSAPLPELVRVTVLWEAACPINNQEFVCADVPDQGAALLAGVRGRGRLRVDGIGINDVEARRERRHHQSFVFCFHSRLTSPAVCMLVLI